MTLADYMFQEKKEEEDLPELKTALTHPYNDPKTIYKNTKGTDYSHQKRNWEHDEQHNDNN